MAPAFRVEEATIADIHAAYRSGQLTARALVEAYIARIEAYDKSGPQINAVITLNRRALDEADALDRALADTKELTGPLHGIPVLVKDQVETQGITTTFGSIAMDGYQPSEDAAVIKKVKAAGAIVLAKTTLPDFATSWFSFSSKLEI